MMSVNQALWKLVPFLFTVTSLRNCSFFREVLSTFNRTRTHAHTHTHVWLLCCCCCCCCVARGITGSLLNGSCCVVIVDGIGLRLGLSARLCDVRVGGYGWSRSVVRCSSKGVYVRASFICTRTLKQLHAPQLLGTTHFGLVSCIQVNAHVESHKHEAKKKEKRDEKKEDKN